MNGPLAVTVRVSTPLIVLPFLLVCLTVFSRVTVPVSPEMSPPTLKYSELLP